MRSPVFWVGDQVTSSHLASVRSLKGVQRVRISLWEFRMGGNILWAFSFQLVLLPRWIARTLEFEIFETTHPTAQIRSSAWGPGMPKFTGPLRRERSLYACQSSIRINIRGNAWNPNPKGCSQSQAGPNVKGRAGLGSGEHGRAWVPPVDHCCPSDQTHWCCAGMWPGTLRLFWHFKRS